MVELLRDVVGEFQMLPLVVAHRHAGRMIGVNVRGHQVRIDIQAGRRILPVLSRLILELRHAVEPAKPSDTVKNPGQLCVGENARLQEQDMARRIDAARQQNGRHLQRLPTQRRRILPDRDGVQIHHAPKALVVVLKPDPVADRTKVVPQRGYAGRLNA